MGRAGQGELSPGNRAGGVQCPERGRAATACGDPTDVRPVGISQMSGLSEPAVLPHLEGSGGILDCVEQEHLQWSVRNGENPAAFVQLHTQAQQCPARFLWRKSGQENKRNISFYGEKERETCWRRKVSSTEPVQEVLPWVELVGSRGSCCPAERSSCPGGALALPPPGIGIPSTRCSCLPCFMAGIY